MSHNYASSGSSTPDSSYRSDHRHDSDTTPSPSGCRSPTFDPQAFSTKLALYEASQSLSVAAETLAAAAQAMSKAAASLVLASGNLPTENLYEKPRASADQFGYSDLYPNSGSWSPIWQQSSYVLSGNDAAPGNGISRGNLAFSSQTDTLIVQPVPVDRTSGIEPGFLADVQVDQAPLSDHRSSLDLADREKDTPDRSACATSIFESTVTVSQTDTTSPQTKDTPTAPVQVNDGPPITAPSVTAGPAIDVNKSARYQDADIIDPEVDSRLEDQPNARTTKPLVHTSTTAHDTTIDLTSPVEPESTRVEPVSFDMTLEPKSHFKLTCASDELPTVAFLCQQYPRTICFYRYWDAAQSLANTASLRSMVGRLVIAPTSLKAKQVPTTIADFLERPKSVLLWPSNTALSELQSLVLKPDIQVIHIGYLSTLNDCSGFTRAFVVTNEKLLSVMPAKRRNRIQQEYPIHPSNDKFNERGSTSVLHLHRPTLRASLAGESLAPPIYKAFISYHRVCNAIWTVHELADHANEYARDYLLRGDSKVLGEMVRGRICLKRVEVAKWMLEPAVQSGAILVGA